MKDTIVLAIIIGGGAITFVAIEFLKEKKIMKMRRKALKQKEMKKKLQAKWSKRRYQNGKVKNQMGYNSRNTR